VFSTFKILVLCDYFLLKKEVLTEQGLNRTTNKIFSSWATELNQRLDCLSFSPGPLSAVADSMFCTVDQELGSNFLTSNL